MLADVRGGRTAGGGDHRDDQRADRITDVDAQDERQCRGDGDAAGESQ